MGQAVMLSNSEKSKAHIIALAIAKSCLSECIRQLQVHSKLVETSATKYKASNNYWKNHSEDTFAFYQYCLF